MGMLRVELSTTDNNGSGDLPGGKEPTFQGRRCGFDPCW